MKRVFQAAFLFIIVMSVYLSLMPTVASPHPALSDKIIHAISYLGLILALDFSWKSGQHVLIKSIVVLIYSVLIEVAQSMVPGRHASIDDVWANAAGIMVFILLVPIFKWLNMYRLLRLN